MNAGFRTTKTETGFAWEVYQVISSLTPNARGTFAEFVTMQKGIRPTRQQALGAAKRWTLYYRRGGK